MSYLNYRDHSSPTGFKKLLHVNWALILIILAISCYGFMMLYSVAGGDFEPWLAPQFKRFLLGITIMSIIAFVPIWVWRNMAGPAYIGAFLLLITVEIFGTVGMGAQRWIDLGFMRLQPSELMKVALIMILAAYYDWLDLKKVSHPIWVAIPAVLILLPVALVLRQPDLGTSLLLIMGGGTVMLLAGVSWWYFGTVFAAGLGVVTAVFTTRGTSFQLLKDYQYRRIDTFLDPASDPLGAGYHITQSKIALGSGGWTGRGFMQGTQSRLNFLPEKHTDFIFTTLAEEFGFLGGISLLGLYLLVIMFCIASALRNSNRFGALLTMGIAMTFFLFFSVNMSMVMGMAPVVGVPLPLVSYGGSAMLVLLVGFGLVQSAHIHRKKPQ
ncbi:MAG: rod shape-determining protein RodA [Halocynthiibacter sp.]